MPRQGIMLCSPFNREKVAKWIAWDGCVYAQPKLNGERCRATSNGTDADAVLWSSEANQIESVPHIKAQMNELAERILLPFAKLHVDGELYKHGMPKQDIMSIVGRRVNLHPNHTVMNYYIFDLVIPEASQTTRYGILSTTIENNLVDLPNLKVLKAIYASSVAEVDAFLVECMSDGYEGIVVRRATSKWVAKRSTEVLKWKPRGCDSYLIVGWNEEVSIEGEPKDSLGSFECMTDAKGTFSVGTGSLLTHAKRRELWRVRDTLVGKYLVVKYPELTNRGVPSQPVAVDII